MPFEEVDYWDELTDIFDWARTHVSRAFNICWGGQAALYHYYGVPKHAMADKLSGVFEHRVVTPNSALLRGFADRFLVPVSRYTETRRADIEAFANLRILAESDRAGLCLVEDTALNQVFMFNHLEYDTDSLANEYSRDVNAGRDIHVPDHYFPDDDPTRAPLNTWRAHGHLLYANWINDMYQHAPFDISHIGEDRQAETETAKVAHLSAGH